MRSMTHPMLHIRKEILGMRQAEMATLTGVQQATVSRWERGELEPSRDALDAIRTEARKRKIAWDDKWFFESPSAAPAPKKARAA